MVQGLHRGPTVTCSELGFHHMTASFCPAQQRAFDGLQQLLPHGSVFLLQAKSGQGRSTILAELHRTHGGALVGMQEFFHLLGSRHPHAVEESFEQLLIDALGANTHVFVDDLHLLYHVVGGTCHFYQRNRLIHAPLTTIASVAGAAGKKLIFGLDDHAPDPLRLRGHAVGIPDFEPADYEFLLRVLAGLEVAGKLDYRKLHRFSRELNAHHLHAVAQWIAAGHADADTDQVIDYLRTYRLASNVDLGEVQAVNLHDLEGVDDVVRSLEANIIIPLENDALAAELNLRPKRGVLLAGPPGTGKTTVGRALAHRLRSKFFMLDGSYVAGDYRFFERIQRLFDEAKRNAPSVLFIDDGDVLFTAEDQTTFGLYRYLLTLLDGLESNSAGRVCVMITVMDVARLPPALVRSGRIELWLDMRMPDASARTAILRRQCAELVAGLAVVDAEHVASLTEGFTGADLKRLVEDAKALFAYDRVAGEAQRSAGEYFQQAIETVNANKRRYAEAESRAAARPSAGPAMFLPGVL
jgi:ATP-dependent 26S proteasome regulatory subunit